MPTVDFPADRMLADIAAREWSFRRQHVVRELGAYVPLRGVLPNIDPASQAEKLAFWTSVLCELHELDADALSPTGREDRLVLRQQVEALRLSQVFRDYERPFNGSTSFWDDTAASIREEAFDSERKYRDAIGLMRDMPRYFDEAIANMQAGLARGFSQPAIILPAAIRTIEAVLAQALDDTDYFQPFRAFPQSVPVAVRDDLAQQASVAIADAVLPAYARLLVFMRDVYAAGAVTPIAATELPDGQAYYDAKVREFTTLDMQADDIYDLGLAEVETCSAQMLQAMRASGFDGTLPEFLAFLKNDPQFYPVSAQDLLMRAAWITKKVEAKLDRFFGLLPRRRFAIEPVPDSIAPTYPMGTGAPGLYLLNTHNLAARPLYILPVLTLHEAVPGHCFQMSLAAENDARPAFRSQTYAIAYGNAWALYCEKRLGVEMGIYETPYDLFGMWSLLTLRAVRMVVDVGVHAKGWDYDRARDYMTEKTGLPLPVIEAELKRYISWPGQALGYYLGMMAIERAREKAEKLLGPAFDIRAFHDRILALGPVPMTVVENSIDQMIAEQLDAQSKLA
ncbi:DUF885 family protein [Neorhizobium sp. JUb45]|uniref:DUF885 domain-containing protein n=1 Tax=unclassified Neorhizobium TaxID=2629175 RepID=UPI001051046F|nr:DUF885 family protein [Neorhizobium sp. JUb45]TCR00096.1 uncharacterized protein (DUF885 family) [Neorhizobium sp. JUb45]